MGEYLIACYYAGNFAAEWRAPAAGPS